jgi:hypothetical protein
VGIDATIPVPPIPTARKPSNFLSKGKESLRKVSEKIKEKEKEKEKERERVVSRPHTAQSGIYSESLQVSMDVSYSDLADER